MKNIAQRLVALGGRNQFILLPRLLCVIVVSITLIVGGYARISFAQHTTFEANLEKGKTSKKKTISVGFSSYAKAFKDICTLLAEDGRRDVFAKHLEYAIEEQFDSDCSSCKAFLRSFASACKVPAEKLRKPEPTPTISETEAEVTDEEADPDDIPTALPSPAPKAKKPVQREPSVALLDAVSQAFIRLSEDKKRAEVSAHTVQHLTALLRNPESLQPGEVAYLDILSEFMLAPFQEILLDPQTAISSLGQGASQPDEEVAVDDLFE